MLSLRDGAYALSGKFMNVSPVESTNLNALLFAPRDDLSRDGFGTSHLFGLLKSDGNVGLRSLHAQKWADGEQKYERRTRTDDPLMTDPMALADLSTDAVSPAEVLMKPSENCRIGVADADLHHVVWGFAARRWPRVFMDGDGSFAIEKPCDISQFLICHE